MSVWRAGFPVWGMVKPQVRAKAGFSQSFR